MCSNPALSNKDEYPTFARTDSDWTLAFTEVLKMFKWDKVILIYTKNDKFQAVKEQLKIEFGKSEYNIKVCDEYGVVESIYYSVNWGKTNYLPFMRNLTKLVGGSKYRRVLFFCQHIKIQKHKRLHVTEAI